MDRRRANERDLWCLVGGAHAGAGPRAGPRPSLPLARGAGPGQPPPLRLTKLGCSTKSGRSLRRPGGREGGTERGEVGRRDPEAFKGIGPRSRWPLGARGTAA